MMKPMLTAAVAAALLLAAGQAAAAEHVVKMLNSGADGAMVFEPAVVKAKVGDTVRFVPTNPGHNAEMIAGMFPEGVVATKGAMGKEYVMKVGKAGVYGIKCLPHYNMGMVALVQVGPASNLQSVQAAATKTPGMAKRRFANYLTKIK
ncbi:MAG: plasmid stabilization protein [Caulobacter sp.]|jgi:pseudoazurin|nr:plasmid stabilization protein [Caulobacter sp.]